MDQQKALVPIENSVTVIPEIIEVISNPTNDLQIAEKTAKYSTQATTLEDYQKGLTPNTLTRQMDDILSFQEFLWEEKRIHRTALFNDLSLWQGVGMGLLSEFRSWLEKQGLAMGTIGVRLSTIRQYCRLAHKAGYISAEELAMILLVKGYKGKEARNRDEKREQTRKGNKKIVANFLSTEQVKDLIDEIPTEEHRGIRNRLIAYLLFDMGLRVSEIVDLNIECFLFGEVESHLKFYRRKVHKTQIHKLTKNTIEAAKEYLATLPANTDKSTPLFPGNKQGRLGTNAIRRLIRTQGRYHEIDNLSPHDGRHTWATLAGKRTPLHVLQQAGGWSSLEMPKRYIQESQVANEGVILE